MTAQEPAATPPREAPSDDEPSRAAIIAANLFGLLHAWIVIGAEIAAPRIFTEYGPSMIDDRTVPPTMQKSARRYNAVGQSIRDAVMTLAVMADQYELSAAHVPATVGAAVINMFHMQRLHEEALYTLAEATAQSSALDDAMGRVRRECGRQIQATALRAWTETGNPEQSYKPIADTPLEKMAGDADAYVAHRAAMLGAKLALSEATAQVAVFAGRAESARILAQGLLAGARPFGESGQPPTFPLFTPD